MITSYYTVRPYERGNVLVEVQVTIKEGANNVRKLTDKVTINCSEKGYKGNINGQNYISIADFKKEMEQKGVHFLDTKVLANRVYDVANDVLGSEGYEERNNKKVIVKTVK